MPNHMGEAPVAQIIAKSMKATNAAELDKALEHAAAHGSATVLITQEEDEMVYAFQGDDEVSNEDPDFASEPFVDDSMAEPGDQNPMPNVTPNTESEPNEPVEQAEAVDVPSPSPETTEEPATGDGTDSGSGAVDADASGSDGSGDHGSDSPEGQRAGGGEEATASGDTATDGGSVEAATGGSPESVEESQP